MAEIGQGRSKWKLRLIGILSLIILLILFGLAPESVGIIILLFPLALIVNSKKPATLAVLLIGISLIFQQFMGARPYAFLTGIIGMCLAILIMDPPAQFGTGIVITVLITIISLRRITKKHD